MRRIMKITKAPRQAPQRVLQRGFTLVEILIVVVILGIIATVVIPQFSNASHEARENTLKDDLRYLRIQVQVYKAQHRDVAPGYPGDVTTVSPTEAAFTDQMTHFSDENGATNANASTVFKFGPYLSKLPENPLNGLTTMKIVANGAALPAVDGSTGWIYKPQTQEIVANLTGNDGTGTPYSRY
jgi:general secretion pathway protein G